MNEEGIEEVNQCNAVLELEGVNEAWMKTLYLL